MASSKEEMTEMGRNRRRSKRLRRRGAGVGRSRPPSKS